MIVILVLMNLGIISETSLDLSFIFSLPTIVCYMFIIQMRV